MKSPKTCGSDKCSKSRNSQKVGDKIASTLIKTWRKKGITNRTIIGDRENGIYTIECNCGNIFTTKSIKRKLCNKCQKRQRRKFTIADCKKGAATSLQNVNVSSNQENILAALLPDGYKRNDKQLLNGLEIDILYPNLAVEYNGVWHYKNFHQNYLSTKNRDAIRHGKLCELKIQHYIVGLAYCAKPPQFLETHAYYISQLFEKISPFKFIYNKQLFATEYQKLKNTKGKSGYLCYETVDWFHSYRWTQSTITHNQSAIDCWNVNRNKILDNRYKYATLNPRDLRRYFLLFDYTPSQFSEIIAKNFAKQIVGSTIADPFAGYGNRMLGVCAANKQYIGYDINAWTINGNLLMAHEFDLCATLKKVDSSKIDPIEVDGLITCPPYEYKDQYGLESESDYYDMIHDVFSNFKIRDKGFVVVKPTLINIEKFKKAVGNIRSSYDINWGGMGRNSYHTVFVIG